MLKRLAQDKIKNNNIIDPNFFITPDMGDYVRDNITIKHLQEIEENLDVYNKKGLGAAYFIESPYSTTPGYYNEVSAFVIKASPMIGDKETRLQSYDGDTVYFSLSSVQDGAQSGVEIDINGNNYTGFKDYALQSLFDGNTGDLKNLKFGLRFLGLNAPEITHYADLYVSKEQDNNFILTANTKSIAEIKNNKDYAYDKSKGRSDDAQIQFVQKTDKTWAEVTSKREEDDKIIYTIVSTDDSDPDNTEKTAQGVEARNTVHDQLSDYEDMCIVIDAKMINHNKSDDDAYVAANSIKGMWKKFWGDIDYSYYGYNFWGQDSYKRFLGCIYLKKYIEGYGSVWINLSKYILAKFKDVELLPDYTNNPMKNQNYGFASDAFKMWTYLRDNKPYADALFDISKEDMDDRNQIQKDITGLDFDVLKDFTVMIGDSLFMVPPTSIRCVSQTTAERIPLLRAKGSMVKGSSKNERVLEMTLYFNEDDGINGVPYITKLPNGEPVTYYMNGLRTLISQFKFTPFLPIENEYINQTLNIEAVALLNLQVTTIPGYPKTLAATLSLMEFNYRIYMPELPVPLPDDPEFLTKNMFASTINYEVMRWYYQRAILKGNDVKQYPFDSKEYLNATFGTQTALQPMSFVDPEAQFYIIDKNWLDKQLQVKLAAMSRSEPIKSKPTVSGNAKVWRNEIAKVFLAVNSAVNSNDFKSKLKNLNYEGDATLVTDSLSLYSSEYGSSVYYTQMKRVELDSLGNVAETVHDSKDLASQFLNPLASSFRSTFMAQHSMSSGIEFAERIDKGDTDNIVSFIMRLDIPRSSVLSDSEIDDLMLNLMGEKTVSDKNSNDPLMTYYDKNNSCIYIRLMAKFAKIGSHKMESSFALDTDAPGYKFLAMCAGTDAFVTNDDINNIDGTKQFMDTQSQMADSMTDIKQSIDWEGMNTLSYVPYAMENIIIKNIACVYGNTMSRIGLQAQDGYAPQYAGGQDTVVELTIETTDSNAVALLGALPNMSAQYVRDYRQILPCWPLRFDSEITRLLGVNEVMIENVDITTMPGYPGFYTINMRMVSVDRTMRNKEALKKLDVPVNAGTLSIDGKSSVLTKSYFDLNNTLAKAEVYPDLELPTIDELSKMGFEFIRYKDTISNRIFPDPDFYFVYGWLLGSEIFRNSIIENLKEKVKDADGNETDNPMPTFDVSDKYGDGFSITPVAKYGYTYKASNSKTEANKSMKNEFDKIADRIKNTPSKNASSDPNSETMDLNQSEMIATMSNLDTYGSWNIADTVKCIFREKQYDDVYFSNSTQKDENAKFFKEKIDERAKAIKELINDELSNEISLDHNKLNNNEISFVKKEIKECVWDYFFNEDGVGYKILNQLGSFNGTENGGLSWWPWGDKTDVCNHITELMWSAAAAASGQKEYEEDKDDLRWQAHSFTSSTDSEGNIVPYVMKEEFGTNGGIYQAASMDDALLKGITFGPFQTKLYTKDEIQRMSETAVEMNGQSRTLLDPAYKGKTREELKPLLKALIEQPYTATQMFLRNAFFWLEKMADDSLIISIYDLVYSQAIENIGQIHSDANMEDAANARGYAKNDQGVWVPNATNTGAITKDMLDQAEQAKKNYVPGQSVTTSKTAESTSTKTTDAAASDAKKEADAKTGKLIDMLQKTMEENKAPLGVGKIFVPMLLAVTSGDDYLYSLIKERNYDTLNELVHSIPLPSMAFSNGQESTNIFRKFVLAMGGYDLYKDLAKIGTTKTKNVAEVFAELVQEKIYLEAAEDPRQYLMHSFYDMIVNDKRGRMLRAFPTFYMMFVDEGREIGLWKMHDNFYNMSAISEIQVTKSRKIAADTARIVMTNMYNTFDTTDEDSYLVNDYGIKDVFNSIFSPRTYFMKEEAKRLQQADIQRAKLVPGTRIHLRMGYGANASELPIIFNGCIAEIGNGESFEIIAQGDGVELVNPILTKSDAEDVQNQDDFIVSELWKNWITNGATPRTILGSFLMTKGGWLNKTVFDMTDGRFFNKNPYGISHFGDPDYKPIFRAGEVVQNIYEGASKPSWSEDNAEDELFQFYGTEAAPRLSTHVFGKSYWDTMHICRSACPDYMTSVVPFGLRSSIFFGPPRAYYAYEYTKDANNVIKEKRKPFQQYHIYNSYADIIANNVKASNKEVRTCAVGLYTGYGWFGSEKPEKVGPMWVDFDIYPENQRTMTVDTQFLAKGTALGDIIPFMNKIQNELGKGDSKYFQSGYQIAWRMTASALKDSIKDMYDGEVIVIGDPSVKPYDRMWIHDTYEQIQGSAEVEAVIHNFSVNTGYTTSIFADCIASIDDKYEQISQHWGNDIVLKSIIPYAAVVTSTLYFSHIGKPVMKVLGSYAMNGGEKAVSFVNAISGILGKDELIKNEAYLKKFQPVTKFFGVDAVSVKFDSLLKGIESYKKSLGAFGDIEDLGKIANRMNDLASSFAKMDGKTIVDVLSSSSNGDVSAAISEMNAHQKRLAQEIARFNNEDAILRLVKLAEDGGANADDVAQLFEKLTGGVKTSDNVKDLSKLIKLASVYAGDNKEAVDIAKIFTSTAKIAKTSVESLSTATEASAAVVKGAGAVAAGLTTTGGLMGVAAALLPTLIIMGATTVLTSFAYQYIERWMRNLQVLQIFPLKKNGFAWTAGLNGSKGVIFGSPSYNNDSETIEGYIAKIFGDKPNEGLAASIMKGLFVTDNMREIANNYKKSLDIPLDADDEVAMNKTIEDLLYAVNADEVRKHDSYRAMMMQKRVDDLSSQEGKLSYIRSAIMTPAQENDIPDTMMYLLAQEEQTLTSHKDKGHLTILHEQTVPSTQTGIKNSQKYFAANGQNNGNGINVPVLEEDDGSIDLPFLRSDAYYALSHIMSNLDDEFSSSSEGEGFDKHHVTLQSCLRTNEPASKRSWANTGYSFTINVADYSLEKLLKSLDSEAKADMAKINNTASPFLTWRMLSDNTANILIYPPKNS